MVSTHVNCMIHQMSNCTASSVKPDHAQTTEAMKTVSEIYE